MSCRLISTSKGYDIVCEFLRMATFNVYFHPQNGSQKRVVNCLLFDELQCFNDPGFVYQKHVSSTNYITIPDTFERTPGEFVCQLEESRAENTTFCVWPPTVPENDFTEGTSLTYPILNIGISMALGTGALLFFGLLIFQCKKKKTQTLETITREKDLALRVWSICSNKENSKKRTAENNIPLKEPTTCPTNKPLLQQSVDNEIKKDSISESLTAGDAGAIV